MVCDVAYGTSVLKYTDGEKQVVPHAILVARFKHVITYYQKYCDESFQPLSEPTLYRILNELNPSQRKSLAGLDDTTADGLNGSNFEAKFFKKTFDKIKISSQIKICCQNHFRFQRKGFIYMFQTSLTEVVFPYRFFSLNCFSKKKTFRNRLLNFSIMEVTFK